MLRSEEQLDNALELALVTLGQVAATGSNEEKVKAASALLQGVALAYEVSRKAALASRLLPLVDAVTRNLSGQLTESDPYAPAYSLEPTQQASLLAAFTKNLT